MGNFKEKILAFGLDRIGAILLIVVAAVALLVDIMSLSALSAIDVDAAVAGLNATLTKNWMTQHAAELNGAQTGIFMTAFLIVLGALNFFIRGRRTVGATALAASLIALLMDLSGVNAVLMVLAVVASALLMAGEGRTRGGIA